MQRSPLYYSPGQAVRGPSIERVVAESPQKCRCGTHLQPGDRVFAVVGLEEGVADMLRGRNYCTGHCVRAEFLEMLETLDALVGNPKEAMVSDLRHTYAELTRTFAVLLKEGYLPVGPG